MILAKPVDRLSIRGKLFRGLADPSRLAILEALRDEARTVSEIVEATALHQPNVSNHLSCLRDCGLVIRSQKGRYVSYTLSDPKVDGLLQMADALLAEVAHGVYACTHYNVEGDCENGPSTD